MRSVKTDGATVFNAAFNHQRHTEQPELDTELVAHPQSSGAPVYCPVLSVRCDHTHRYLLPQPAGSMRVG